MGNTQKQLTALNTDSIRNLVNTVNELGIQKEDVLKLVCEKDSYYLLYYRDA